MFDDAFSNLERISDNEDLRNIFLEIRRGEMSHRAVIKETHT